MKKLDNTVEKENLLPQETTSLNKIKGKGIGKKTKREAIMLMEELYDIREENVGTGNAFTDRRNDNIDVNDSVLDKPVYFDDKLDYVDSEVIPDPSTSKPQRKIKKIDNSVDKETLLPKETINLNKSIKGKGIGKKTKREASMLMEKLYDIREENLGTGNAFTDKQNDYIDVYDSVLDMPVYFEDDLECGGELTIENCPLSDDLLIVKSAAAKNIVTGLNNVSQSDHAGETNYPLGNNEEEYSVAEVITDTLPKTKKEKIKIIENKNFLETGKNINYDKKYKKVFPEAPLIILKKTARPSKYYKDDEAILRDLLDDNT